MINKHIQKISARAISAQIIHPMQFIQILPFITKICYLKQIQACTVHTMIILICACLNFWLFEWSGKFEISQGKVREFWYLVWVATLFFSQSTTQILMWFDTNVHLMPSVHRHCNWKQPVVSELPATESNWLHLISSRIWSVCDFLPLVVHSQSLRCY